jgi:hypothetical protein
VRAVDLRARQDAAGGPRRDYDLYPHHIWSNPWLFDDFAGLAPDKVVSYVYEVTSSCVSLADAGPASRIVLRREHPIMLDRGSAR